MEGKGFRGKACDDAMSVFEKALGMVQKRRNKPEYYQEVRNHAKQRS